MFMTAGHATPLIPEQRQAKLLQLLRDEGIVGTRILTDYLGVSHMTVRRDIAALEAEGRVVSVKGGVRLAGAGPIGAEPPRERLSRAVLELPRKTAIARFAAGVVADAMVIYLDAGTTCQALVPLLADRKDLTVVTNDFLIATSLFDLPNVEIIHTGGVVDRSSGSSSGRLAANTLAAINLDLFFMSTGAWSISRGVSSFSMDKVELKLAAMAASSECVLLADSTKYGAAAKFHVTPLAKLDMIVTDDQLPERTSSRITELGVELHTVAP
jgi:DeoR/GlpR family transcriptional regulator of sugar metabolism